MLPAFAARAIFLGGGLFGNVIGGALKGAGAAAGGAAQGAGSAVGGIAQGIGTAVGGALTPAPKVVVNNVGMAGEAGKKKISGGGTLPAPKKAAKPSVNVNMPTEKLLVVAVNYLSSIDKTLQDQLKFESQAFNQQAVAEREASIEGEKTGIFTKMSDKLGGLLKTDEDSTIGSRASTITKAILAASGIAALGALAMGGMEDTELARLKTSWSAFSEKFSWLIDLGKAITSVGGVVGYLFGGVRGAIVGIVADVLAEKITGKSFGDMALGSLGLGGGQTDAAPSGNSIVDYGIGAAAVGYGAFRGVKTYNAVSKGMSQMTATKAAPRVMSSGGRLGFKDPVTGKIASKAASSTGGGWLSSSKGRKFVAFLSKRFGKTYIARKVMPFLGRAFAGVAISATGIGLIPGILFTLINIGLSVFLVYELVSAWYDFQAEEELNEANATAVPRTGADATAASTRTGSGSITGAPTASLEETQNLPQVPADVEKILATIRTRESGGNYGAQNPGGSASGAYQFIDSTWNSLTSKYSIGTGYPKAKLAPPEIQDAVAAAYVQDILKEAGGDVSKVPLAWYTGNIRGQMSASAVAANNGLTPQQYQSKWMETYTGGQYTASSYDLQGGDGLASRMMTGAADLTTGLMKSIGGIARAGFGAQSSRKLTDSLSSYQAMPTAAPNTSGGGASTTATPMSTETKKAAEIAAVSGKIQTAIDIGNPKSDPAVKIPETSGQRSLRGASSDSKLESIDPNYPGTGGVNGYLQYYRLAA